MYDATLAAFAEKMRVNAVRPTTAIRYLYANQNITSYAGPLKGTRTFPGREWNSYMRTMPHSDSPSATACICIAFAEMVERYNGELGQPTMTYGANFPQGCSPIEPDAVPAQEVVDRGLPISCSCKSHSSLPLKLNVFFNSTEAFIRDCTQTRLWSGVHFQKSVDLAVEMCRGIGPLVFDKIVSLR